MWEVTWRNLFGARFVSSRHRTKGKAVAAAKKLNDPKRTQWAFVPGFKPSARVRRAK